MRTLILAACLILGLAASGGFSSFRDSMAEPSPRGINAQILWKAFADSPEEAEKLYIGQNIAVEGYVAETGMSVYMTPVVRLAGEKDGPIRAICVLPRLDAGKLSEFSKGQKAVMSGRGYRFTERGVVLKECRLMR